MQEPKYYCKKCKTECFAKIDGNPELYDPIRMISHCCHAEVYIESLEVYSVNHFSHTEKPS
jgi:hypothetical protein